MRRFRSRGDWRAGACALLGLTFCASPAVAAAPPEPVASYRFVARLDCETHGIDATGTIQLTNRSDATLTELWFHLYPNAFANANSRFLRTSPGKRRSGQTLYYPGSLEIRHLRIANADGPNLWERADISTPGDPDDTTDRRVPLPEPLAPGETLTLDVRFVTRLPFIVERMGWAETFHAVAQWYPKLARLERDGTWRHFPYEPLAEFSADFGDYDMTIDAPDPYVIAAPGDRSLVGHARGRTQTRFRLHDAHDFAFFAWDRFVQTDRELRGIEVQSFAPPGHGANVATEFATLGFGLKRYQARYGPYPYSKLVVVHPPDVAAAASGMEYPGLIVTGGPWYLRWTGSRSLEAVTLHELAHQWFYGVIANDERRYPVLDEGLATWLELDGLGQLFGSGSAFSGFGVTVSARAVVGAFNELYAEPGPLARPAGDFRSFRGLSGTVYARTAVLFETLSNVYGSLAFERALSRYAMRERYENPTPEDLVSAVDAELGTAAARNLRTALVGNGWIDFTVGPLSSRRVGPENWVSSVQLHRRGTMDLPTTVSLTLRSGTVLSRDWPVERSDWTLSVTTPEPVSRVTVDPENKITLESSRLDNVSWRARPSIATTLLDWLEYLMAWLLGAVMP